MIEEEITNLTERDQRDQRDMASLVLRGWKFERRHSYGSMVGRTVQWRADGPNGEYTTSFFGLSAVLEYVRTDKYWTDPRK